MFTTPRRAVAMSMAAASAAGHQPDQFRGPAGDLTITPTGRAGHRAQIRRTAPPRWRPGRSTCRRRHSSSISANPGAMRCGFQVAQPAPLRRSPRAGNPLWPGRRPHQRFDRPRRRSHRHWPPHADAVAHLGRCGCRPDVPRAIRRSAVSSQKWIVTNRKLAEFLEHVLTAERRTCRPGTRPRPAPGRRQRGCGCGIRPRAGPPRARARAGRAPAGTNRNGTRAGRRRGPRGRRGDGSTVG